MCLIIAGKSNQIRATLLNTPSLIEDIYNSNSDGIGAMYVSAKGRLRTPKLVPKSLREFTGFIRQLPDDERNIAIHARMKTHGDIDLENCHPYTVLPGRVAMMHNGVLSQGNKDDESKSDTWHYIKNVVRPQLQAYPKLFTMPSWITLIEADITESNRFVIMDDSGEMMIANRETGIEHDDMWFSNTYAWSPELLIPGYRPAPSWRSYTGSGTGSSLRNRLFSFGFSRDDGDDLEGNENVAEREEWHDDVWFAVGESDPDYLGELLIRRPYTTLQSLFGAMNFRCHVDPEEDLSATDKELVTLIEQANVSRLAAMIVRSTTLATKIAETMCWYGEWDGKAARTEKDQATRVNPLLPAELQSN